MLPPEHQGRSRADTVRDTHSLRVQHNELFGSLIDAEQQECEARALADLNWWVKELSGSLPILELCEDNQRPPKRSFDGYRVPLVLSSTVAHSLERVAHNAGTNMFSTLLTVFQIALCVHSRQDEVVVGVPFQGEASSGFFDRYFVEREKAFASNRLPIHTTLHWQQSFSETLKVVSAHMQRAQEHGFARFRDVAAALQEASHIAQDPSRHAVFQAFFEWRVDKASNMIVLRKI